METRFKLLIVLLVGVFVTMAVTLVVVAALATRRYREGGAPVADSAPQAPGNPLERIRARGSLRVLMDTGTPAWTGAPPSYVPDVAGGPGGLDYDVAKVVATHLGVPEVKVLHARYVELATSLAANQDADLVVAGFVPYPAEGLAWSEAYLEFGLCLIVPAESKAQTIDDLWGKRIGIFPDDDAEEKVKRLVKGYRSLDRIEAGYFDLLLTDKLDAYIYDLPFAQAEIETHYARFPHQAGKLRIAQYNLTDSTYNVAVRSGDTELLGAVNEAIAAWRATPDYATTIRSWLSGAQTVALGSGEAASNQKVHVVAVGETLSRIAAAELGDPARWSEIWDLNKSRIANPNLIEVGDPLVLP